MHESQLSYAAQQVRRHDRERFVTALFAPVERREGLLALYAFNLEVARVRESVREPMMGRIRLQWWRDVVEAIYAGTAPPQHPIAEPLAQAVRRFGLDRAGLDRLIDGREADLDPAGPADMAALEAYAEATSSALVGLALEVLAARDDAALAAGREVGIAWALTGLLRALPFHAGQGRLTMPADLLAAHGVSPDRLLAGKPGEGMAAVAQALARRARDHLAAARRQRVPRRAVPALLPAVLAERSLKGLERRRWDPFAPGWAEIRPRPLRLAAAALVGRF